MRGIAPSPRAGNFGMNSMNYLKKANEEILIFIQIESAEGVKNIEEIVKVEGVDGIFVGPMDLATSMGYFCNPQADEVKAAVKRLSLIHILNTPIIPEIIVPDKRTTITFTPIMAVSITAK